ncbi:MAG: DUF1553 domain-containing protein, partial [Planctomycetales bacterium]|nr:DUF1553 domain-containing protein [Planctomycetales bacterium]
RQSSANTAELLQRDPENRLLARAPRFRLPAWMIRDNALHVSGLLNPAIGGPPVFPYQPEGVWAEITMGRFDYDPSLGPAQYRRTIYGFWRRSVAPTFLFDSAQRRVCEVGLRRTNTPLHALTLMNDTTMLESCRALADLAFDQANTHENRDQLGQVAEQAKVRNAFTIDADTWTGCLQSLAHRVLNRRFTRVEVEQLRDIWQSAFVYFQEHATEAADFATIGQQTRPTQQAAPMIASWMTVATAILNLDEAMTRE